MSLSHGVGWLISDGRVPPVSFPSTSPCPRGEGGDEQPISQVLRCTPSARAHRLAGEREVVVWSSPIRYGEGRGGAGGGGKGKRRKSRHRIGKTSLRPAMMSAATCRACKGFGLADCGRARARGGIAVAVARKRDNVSREETFAAVETPRIGRFRASIVASAIAQSRIITGYRCLNYSDDSAAMKFTRLVPLRAFRLDDVLRVVSLIIMIIMHRYTKIVSSCMVKCDLQIC